MLVSDREAEHIPGCNMAFRKDCLEAIGGFDPQFRVAGDDVDICWRLQDEGWTLGFSPAAMVWHHRRNTVRALPQAAARLRQGGSAARAQVAARSTTAAATSSWSGRVYGNGCANGRRRWRIYYGTWGSALFQSIYAALAGNARLACPSCPSGIC